MPVNAPSSAIVRYDLSLRRNDWDQKANEAKYIGLQVMPAAGVAKQSSNFTRLPIGVDLLPPDDLTRMPRAAYKRDEFGWVTDSYTTAEHGFEAPVDDAEIEMYGDFLPVEQISAMRVLSKLLAEHEDKVAKTVFNSGSYTSNQNINLTVGGTTNVTASFQDTTFCDPTLIIKKAKWQCRKFGVRANALVIPEIGLDWLTQCDAVINRIKYSGRDDPKDITIEMLKALFKLDYILVGDGFKNSAGPGQTPTLARFWDPTMCWVGRIADPATELTYPSICVGRTVMFTEQNAQIPGVGEQSAEPAIIMEEYREEQRRGGVIRGRWNWQIKPFDDPMDDNTFFRAGVLITNTTDGTII